MHKKDFNKPRNPVFTYADWHWPTKSRHRPTFSPLTAMIMWFHSALARIEVKNALFGPLELPLNTTLKTHLFSTGFLRVSTGFLRVSYGLENPSFFWKPGVLRVRTGFLRFTTGFLRVLNSTIKKPKKSIIFHRGEEIWPWHPQIPATNVGFLFKFNFKVRKRSLRGKVRKNASL